MAFQAELPYGDLKPWERRPKEATAAWRAFELYRDLGKRRTLAEAYRQWRAKYRDRSSSPEPPPAGNGIPGPWKRWAKEWDWEGRIRAYDTENERSERSERLKLEAELAERKRRHAIEIDDKLYGIMNRAADRLSDLLKNAPGKVRRIKKVNEPGIDASPNATIINTPLVEITEMDQPRAIKVLSVELVRLKQEYFGETETMAPAGDGGQSVDNDIADVLANPEASDLLQRSILAMEIESGDPSDKT